MSFAKTDMIEKIEEYANEGKIRSIKIEENKKWLLSILWDIPTSDKMKENIWFLKQAKKIITTMILSKETTIKKARKKYQNALEIATKLDICKDILIQEMRKEEETIKAMLQELWTHNREQERIQKYIQNCIKKIERIGSKMQGLENRMNLLEQNNNLIKRTDLLMNLEQQIDEIEDVIADYYLTSIRLSKYKKQVEFHLARQKVETPETSDFSSINNLSEQERKNYEIKKEVITSTEKDMRVLGDKEYFFPQEDRNNSINMLLVKNVLLPKLELTYTEFETKFLKEWWDKELLDILQECKKNSENHFKKISNLSGISNKGLRNWAKVARWETFLFTTNNDKDHYIVLEIQKVNKDMGIDVLRDQEFFVRRHIDEYTDISRMSDILLKWKKIFDYYLTDKKIRYLISSSWLFDDEFNDFWMKERIKEWNSKIPNRIKMREEWLKNYGWKLPPEEVDPNDPIESHFRTWEDNSMTRAMKKYLSEWKKIKIWWWYIDLEALERWKNQQEK